MREDLGYLISTAISRSITAHQISSTNGNQYIHDFARYIVKIASKRADLAKNTESATKAKNYDPVSIISLNWDILPDNALYKSLSKKIPVKRERLRPVRCCGLLLLHQFDRERQLSYPFGPLELGVPRLQREASEDPRLDELASVSQLPKTLREVWQHRK